VSVTDTGDFRPTTLMERVSRYLEDESGATLRTVRTDVSGKAAYVDQALRVLVAEGFVSQRADGQARRHYVVNMFREEHDRVPVSQPCPGHG
jgi:Arc/MetJ family transcription regulator